jgi:hypothetical protein
MNGNDSFLLFPCNFILSVEGLIPGGCSEGHSLQAPPETQEILSVVQGKTFLIIPSFTNMEKSSRCTTDKFCVILHLLMLLVPVEVEHNLLPANRMCLPQTQLVRPPAWRVLRRTQRTYTSTVFHGLQEGCTCAFSSGSGAFSVLAVAIWQQASRLVPRKPSLLGPRALTKDFMFGFDQPAKDLAIDHEKMTQPGLDAGRPKGRKQDNQYLQA